MNKNDKKMKTFALISLIAIGFLGFGADTALAQYYNYPNVTTRSATDIDQDSATLRGYIDSNGGPNTRVWFEWGTSSNNYSNRTPARYYGSTNGTYFEYTIYGLSSDRTYYFRAVAQNNYGRMDYGSKKSFRTDDYDDCDYYGDCDSEPYVVTYAASSVREEKAVLNGYVDPNGDYTHTWFEWGTSYSNLNHSSGKDSHGTRRNDFKETISHLAPGVTYYFRAVARNSEGTSRGSILSFKTTGGYYPNSTCAGNCAPSVVSTIATNIGRTSARLNGIVTAGSSVYTAGYFEYGPTPALGLSTAQKSVGGISSSVPFSASLFNLPSNTTYYFRAVVTNQYGTSIGNTLSFTTRSAAAASSTVSSSSSRTNTPPPANITTTNSGDSRLGAATILGTGFLPNTLIGWLLFVLLVLVAIAAVRWLYDRSALGLAASQSAENGNH